MKDYLLLAILAFIILGLLAASWTMTWGKTFDRNVTEILLSH